MSTVEQALAAALDARHHASTELANANAQIAMLEQRRAEAARMLEEARGAVRTASAGLVAGGGEKAFDEAMRLVERLQAQVRTFDEDVIPAARTACAEAEAAVPSEGMIAALELRLAAQQRLSPLYAQHSKLADQLDSVLAEIVRENEALRAEHRPAWGTLFGSDPRANLSAVLRCVPPAVRQVYAMLFVDHLHQSVHQDRAFAFDVDVLANFIAVIDREPSMSELSRFNPRARPPEPLAPPEPRPEPGPSTWGGGAELRIPGTPAPADDEAEG